MDMEHVYLAVIAGGEGTRLFPYSHPERPKQFCPLNSEDTFIQATIKNFEHLGVKPSHIVIIVTNDNQKKLAVEQTLPKGVLKQNIYQIPATFGYVGAMIEAAKFIKEECDKDAIIVNTPSDQFLEVDEVFETIFKNALSAAKEGKAVVIGAEVQDEVVASGLGHAVYDVNDTSDCPAVVEIIEKPDIEQAKALLRRQDSAANTGINIWSVDHVLGMIEKIGIDYSDGSLKTDDFLKSFIPELCIATGRYTWHDCGTLESLYGISKKGPRHANVNIGKGNRERNECLRSLFICDEGFNLFCTKVEDAAVVASMVGGKPVVVVCSLEASQTVKALANKYKDHEEYLLNDFCLNAHGNDALRSNVDYVAGFVSVDNYGVSVYERKDKYNNAVFDIYVAKKMTASRPSK